MRRYAIAMIATQSFATTTWAQQPLMLNAPSMPTLRVGTEIPVALRNELTTKNKALRVGQRFEVETREPTMLDGHVVIPVGTSGVGEVTSVTNKGMWGKSGHFDVRLLYLRVGNRQVRLSGTLDDKGVAGGVGAAAVSAIVFLPAGFFMTGTSAHMAAGTIIKGVLDEDVPVSFADATQPTPPTTTTPVPSLQKPPVPASSGAVPGATSPVPSSR